MPGRKGYDGSAIVDHLRLLDSPAALFKAPSPFSVQESNIDFTPTDPFLSAHVVIFCAAHNGDPMSFVRRRTRDVTTAWRLFSRQWYELSRSLPGFTLVKSNPSFMAITPLLISSRRRL